MEAALERLHRRDSAAAWDEALAQPWRERAMVERAGRLRAEEERAREEFRAELARELRDRAVDWTPPEDLGLR